MRDDNRYVYRLVRVYSHHNEPQEETIGKYRVAWQALNKRDEIKDLDEFSEYFVEVDYAE